MPSIPLYGYDELEPSLLNSAKRRVIGYQNTGIEHLTDKPTTDPTNGNQNILVERLTEEIYNVVKDVEILDTYIRDDSASATLRLTSNNAPNTLRALRPELKKGASQIASINNALRKINTTYDKLRSAMIYTDLKTHTDFINSIRTLKKSSLEFFEIVDKFIANIREAEGIAYVRPDIVEGDTSIDTEFEIVATPDPNMEGIPPPPLPPPLLPPIPQEDIETIDEKLANYAMTLDTDVFDELDKQVKTIMSNYGVVPTQSEIDRILQDIQANPPASQPTSQPTADEKEERQAISDYIGDTGVKPEPSTISRFRTNIARDQDLFFDELVADTKSLTQISPAQVKAIKIRIRDADAKRNVRNNTALETYINFLKQPRVPQTDIDDAIAKAKNKTEESKIQKVYDTYLKTAAIKTFLKTDAKYKQGIYA